MNKEQLAASVVLTANEYMNQVRANAVPTECHPYQLAGFLSGMNAAASLLAMGDGDFAPSLLGEVISELADSLESISPQ